MMQRDVLSNKEEAEIGLYTNWYVFDSGFQKVHITCACEVPGETFASFVITALAGELVGRGWYWWSRVLSLPFSPFSSFIYLREQCLCNSNLLLSSKAHILPFPLSEQREKCEDRSTLWAAQI